MLPQSSHTTANGEVILHTQLDYSAWYLQLQGVCARLKLWNYVDPEQHDQPMTEPIKPIRPQPSQYVTFPSLPSGASRRNTRGATTAERADDPEELSQEALARRATMQSQRTTPSSEPALSRYKTNDIKQSDLYPTEKAVYKDDMETYREDVKDFELNRRIFSDEQKNLYLLHQHFSATVAPYLKKLCCRPNQSFRDWVIALRAATGVDTNRERTELRMRYQKALSQKITEARWDAWLLEYEQATMEAEEAGIATVTDIHFVIQDFIAAVSPVASTWAPTFLERASREPVLRKDLIQSFRNFMINKPKAKHTAFAAAGPSFAGESDNNKSNQRPSQSEKPRRTRRHTPRASTSPQSPRISASSNFQRSKRLRTPTPDPDEKLCDACLQPYHDPSTCFYIHKDNAPDWFIPMTGIQKSVDYRMTFDEKLITLSKARQKRNRRTATPMPKEPEPKDN
jgi:hypothetical protein